MTATKTVADRIAHLSPCGKAMEWAKDYTSPQKAWNECQRGDWMLWLIGRQVRSEPWSDERKPLLACALDCACTVRHLWPKNQAKKVGNAVDMLRKWIEGYCSAEKAKKVRNDLYAAADAADADDADADARSKVLAECAAIVRSHYPKPPKIKRSKA